MRLALLHRTVQNTQSYLGTGWTGLDGIYLRPLLRLEHLAVLTRKLRLITLPKATFLDSLLEVDHEKKLYNGRNIANAAEDKGDNLELLYGEEHRPKWKRAPNLFYECRNRNGKDEHLGESSGEHLV